VLTPPDGLPGELLAHTVAREWGRRVASAVYRPVGFGSHHWEVLDRSGRRWFATVDELDVRRRSALESCDAAFERLTGSLAAAEELQNAGCSFVVAPIPAQDGSPAVRLAADLAVAVYPFVDGRSFAFDDFGLAGHRAAVGKLVAAVHDASAAARACAPADDFLVPHRCEVTAVLASPSAVVDCGPFARGMAELLRSSTFVIRRLFARYDALVETVRGQRARMVLTHGEPHAGNTMLAADGWRLIDWDTAAVAPPERDLWLLDPGDGSVLDGYAARTGRRPRPDALELYRLRWDLADLAVEVARLSRPHTGSADDEAGWAVLQDVLARATC